VILDGRLALDRAKLEREGARCLTLL